jgi:three-Cys-motif partner protein
VHWDTLCAVARTRAIDVWYLFPLSGVYRQMARDRELVDDSKAAALTRILGTTEWRDVLYRESPNFELFGDPRMHRREVPEIRQFVTDRLMTVFPKVIEPRTICLPGSGGRPGAPLFDLYFAVSNSRRSDRDGSPGAGGSPRRSDRSRARRPSGCRSRHR